MKTRIVIIILMCAVMLGGGLACTSSDVAPNGMTGAEILAMSGNTTMDTMQFDAQVSGRFMEETMVMSMSGVVDEPNRQMYLAMTISEFPGDTGELYIVDNWIYIFDPDLSAGWVKTSLTDDIWESQDISGQQLALLENAIDVRYTGMENIGGASCYKVEVTPNWGALFSAMDMGDEDMMTQQEIEEFMDAVKKTTVFAWIAENTYYPMKVSFSIEMEFDFLGSELSMAMDMSMTLSNINEPLNITLPAAAQNAQIITYEQFISGEW